MRPLSEAQLLTLWENGIARHPIDRNLLLCAVARPDLPPDGPAGLPLGAVNLALLSLRRACFGDRLEAYLDCARCGERLELALDTAQLIAGAREGDVREELAVGGLRFRALDSRDLAATARDGGADAALQLLVRCCIEPAQPAIADLADALGEAEAGLEALDPAADLSLAVVCESCGHGSTVALDVGALFWDELAAQARGLMAEVHGLARAYGWSEPDILALPRGRRAAYLAMAAA
jgi:hypothetical protein